jgi:hypothetical protein
VIEIIDRKDSGKYATSGPAIQVVHTVDQATAWLEGKL